MASTRNTQAERPAPNFPLFYKQPQALTPAVHGDLHLKGERDFRFASATNAVPIMAAEFFEAQRSYPIVFAGEPAYPVVALGLERDNLFVASDGAWAPERYVPAYVRRYPFVFIEAPDRSRYALGVDMASDRLAATGVGEGARPLFENGEPSRLTQEALQFSSALQASQLATRTFCEALVETDLLVEQQAQGTLPDGKPFSVAGFRIVDAARLDALPDAVVLDWRKKGWLTLIDFHLASLGRWRDLLERQGAARSAAA